LVELEDSVRVEYADVIPQLPAIAEVQKWWYQRRVIQRKGMPIHPCLRVRFSHCLTIFILFSIPAKEILKKKCTCNIINMNCISYFFFWYRLRIVR